MKPNKLDLNSMDGTRLNLEALYQIAPSCFTEVKDDKTGELRHVVNFTTLRQLLGDDAVEDTEMYQFTWPGKQEARLEAARPINKTLRPVKEDSEDWDNTQNLYIEGDNLEVLKLLQKSYMGKIKMIYIDPPYNTGNDFVYDDDFKVSQDELDFESGDVDELGNRYRKNTDSNARFHSDWCSMIYARLTIARSLLTNDGIIFISINDYEADNLLKIANEIFGQKNKLAYFCWRTDGNFDNQARIKSCHEYILLYAKNEYLVGLPDAIDPNIPNNSKIYKEHIRNTIIKNGIKNPISSIKIPKGFPTDFEFGTILKETVKWPQYSNSISVSDFRTINEVNATTGWASKAQLEEFINNGYNNVKDSKEQNTHFVLTKNGAIESIKEREKVSHVISVLNNMGGTQKATSDMGELGEYFDYPKPVKLIYYLSKMYSINSDIILDFFSGSATTAHAVMQLNAEDQGNRKYIMVQLPEETDEDSEAYKAGYKNICEIGKERIRRAGKKIKEDNPLTTQNLDTGFRVFRVDSSNFEDVELSPNLFNQGTLDSLIDNVKADRNDLDLLFGAMLSWGVELSLPMSSEKVDGKMVYTVNEGDLVACFAEDITEGVIDAIADKQPLRVLFRDRCFNRDDAKINIFETLKQKLDWSEEEALKNIRVI